MSRTTTATTRPIGANSPVEMRRSATAPSKGARTVASVTALLARPACACAASSPAHACWAPLRAESYWAFACSARARAASQLACDTPPESKSAFVRSASVTARSLASFAARTSGIFSGSNLSPFLMPSRAWAWAACALAAAPRSEGSRRSSSTSGSPFFTRVPTSTRTFVTIPPVAAATSLVSSATSVPLASSVAGSFRPVTLTSAVSIAPAGAVSAAACALAVGAGFLQPAASRAAPASTSAPRVLRDLIGSFS